MLIVKGVRLKDDNLLQDIKKYQYKRKNVFPGIK